MGVQDSVISKVIEKDNNEALLLYHLFFQT